jgi:2-amino-4-hydroxy-6-hydroxymethyldihydropteridine diphosphokinase
MHRETVYIGLGSNLGKSQAQLLSALMAIREIADTQVTKVSSFYRSSPMGPKDQPDYLNAVAQISTGLAPQALLTALQKIENQHGRERKGERWGPRTLDLDILLFGKQKIQTDTLTIPHIGIANREFVLVPLFEIVPNLIMPDGNPLSMWVAQCSLEGLKRLPPSNQP